MAKAVKYTVETCGTKYVLKSTSKPIGYLCSNGKITSFKDDHTLMLSDEKTAKTVVAALNKNQTALIANMVKFMAENPMETGNTILEKFCNT